MIEKIKQNKTCSMVHNRQLTKCLFEQKVFKLDLNDVNLSFGYDLVVDSTTAVRQLKRLYLHIY